MSDNRRPDVPGWMPTNRVAFFAFLSLFPAVVAAVLTYGLVADPAKIGSQAPSWPTPCRALGGAALGQ